MIRPFLPFLLLAGLLAGEPALAPAFPAEAIDVAACRVYAGGKPSPVDEAAMRRCLGFADDGANFASGAWTATSPTPNDATDFAFLVVLRQPVAVGTICIQRADTGAEKLSLTGGSLAMLKAGVAGAPDPAVEGQWQALEFADPQPALRTAVLPPGTTTRAFLYRDRRARGDCGLNHWRILARRLGNLAPFASVTSAQTREDADAGSLVSGGGWGGRELGKGEQGSLVVAWDQPQPIGALLFYSNLADPRLERFTGPPGTPPEVAPDSAWVEFAAKPARDLPHHYQWWSAWYRWYEAARPEPTRAIRIRFTGVGKGDKKPWINGLAAFTDLGAAAPPQAPRRDDRPPYRVSVAIAQAGEATAAIDAPSGRVRNLFAFQRVEAGKQEIAWDLKDASGQYVRPGRYDLKLISAPPLELRYGITPYPNIDQIWRDRTPWLTGHGGEQGWLSDHCPNWAVAADGDTLWFGASMAEAGVCLIECDLDGKKRWGRHDFGAWLGVQGMAADAEALYVVGTNNVVHRLDRKTRASKEIFKFGGAGRTWQFRAVAARQGKVLVTFGEPRPEGIPGPAVDLDNKASIPSGDLARILRLWSSPPGGNDVNPATSKPQGTGKLHIESTQGSGPVQHAVFAFKKPALIGSIVFPHPGGKTEQVTVAVHKAGAAWPPRPDEEGDWTVLEDPVRGGWEVLAAPAGTATRAVRVSFARDVGLVDPLDDKAPKWFSRIDGMRFLRERFADAARSARIRVNSGKVDPLAGWDAQRTAPLAEDAPGIYLMQWDKPVRLRGLAIKEIEGARTLIDVWQGPLSGDAPLDAPALPERSTATGWRTVDDYNQPRRLGRYKWDDNYHARYLDGTVDFGAVLETRAVRLRVVEPWLDNGEHREEGKRADRPLPGGVHITQQKDFVSLDTRICRILGVAALTPLGGDPQPEEAQIGARLAVYDGTTGNLDREIPVRLGWGGLYTAPDGRVYAVDEKHHDIVRIDLEAGRAETVVKDCSPSGPLAVGPDGRIYVFPWSNDRRDPIAVYDQSGKQVASIGKPGGRQVGAWDPQRFLSVHKLEITRDGSLWVLENQEEPRRIVHYRTDGTFVKEILGNTHYGGSGTLDRYDPGKAYKGAMEFALDWKTGTSRLAAFLADGVEGELTALRLKDRTYYVNTPLTLHPTRSRAIVYLRDAPGNGLRMVGAVGAASGWGPLRQGAIIAKLPDGEVPRDYFFMWSDRDGDGKVDAEEVEFSKRDESQHWGGFGPFDAGLGVAGFGAYYALREVLANGAPVWERQPLPVPAYTRLLDGAWFGLHSEFAKDAPSENWVAGADGRKRWGYPASGGVSGLSIAPWQPGLVGNQLCLIGHEGPGAGELGEFLVTNANTGQWFIWTADGLLAGQILLHKNDPRSRFFGPVPCPPGTRMDPLTGSQEHFHGHFSKVGDGGTYRLVAGFTHMSIIDVVGLDRFRRANATIEVAAADISRAQAWEREQEQRRAASKPSLIMATRMARPPKIDGSRGGKEWSGRPTRVGEEADIAFEAAYDDDNLYLCWSAKGAGALANAGGPEWRTLFKTGAALEFSLQTDPRADPARRKPAEGDVRVLIAFVDKRPLSVLYQPVARGAGKDEGWRTFTQAAGETLFDRVVRLQGVEVARVGEGETWTAEAAIPLVMLGLQPKPGLRLRFDWGVITSADGFQPKSRIYWSNKTATGTSDESVESRLEPALWGWLGF